METWLLFYTLLLIHTPCSIALHGETQHGCTRSHSLPTMSWYSHADLLLINATYGVGPRVFASSSRRFTSARWVQLFLTCVCVDALVLLSCCLVSHVHCHAFRLLIHLSLNCHVWMCFVDSDAAFACFTAALWKNKMFLMFLLLLFCVCWLHQLFYFCFKPAPVSCLW